jgi:chitinase
VIRDDDLLPSIHVNGSAAWETGSSGTSTSVFTVSLSPASGRTVTVGYATVDGAAVEFEDYVGQSGSLTFLPGETTKLVAVEVLADDLEESSEELSLKLSDPGQATISVAAASSTILDDKGLSTVQVALSGAAVLEGDRRRASATFTLALSRPATSRVSVEYVTSNGTAIAGRDFEPSRGSVSFLPGDTTKTVTVAVLADVSDEPDETFSLNLLRPRGLSVVSGTATATILDDDAEPRISVADVAIWEGEVGTRSLVFLVRLDVPSGKPISVAYGTADGGGPGGASAPADYSPRSGLLTFSPGSSRLKLVVAARGDDVPEGDETLNVVLASPIGATLADDTGVGTIRDDDW